MIQEEMQSMAIKVLERHGLETQVVAALVGSAKDTKAHDKVGGIVVEQGRQPNP